jgi:hypothetical protein
MVNIKFLINKIIRVFTFKKFTPIYSLTVCTTTSTVAITTICDKLVLPITAPKDIKTAAAQKSATNKLNCFKKNYLQKKRKTLIDFGTYFGMLSSNLPS